MRSDFDISSWREIESRVIGLGVKKLTRSQILDLILDLRDAAYRTGHEDQKMGIMPYDLPVQPPVDWGLPVQPPVDWGKIAEGGRKWMRDIAEKAKRRG